jgi:MFS family permease
LSTGGYEERQRPSRLLTLAIASLASLAAAIVTSEVWDGGVVGTAAVTPVIVALVTDALTPLTRRREARSEQPGSERPRPRRGFLLGALVGAIVIGLLAFLITAVALTVPEVVADKSITGDGGHTTYFGDNKDTPWGEARSWSECLDEVVQCARDIIERR